MIRMCLVSTDSEKTAVGFIMYSMTSAKAARDYLITESADEITPKADALPGLGEGPAILGTTHLLSDSPFPRIAWLRNGCLAPC